MSIVVVKVLELVNRFGVTDGVRETVPGVNSTEAEEVSTQFESRRLSFERVDGARMSSGCTRISGGLFKPTKLFKKTIFIILITMNIIQRRALLFPTLCSSLIVVSSKFAR